MKDYATLPNITGTFPDVEGVNSSGSGATDGTPYIKQVVDDIFGARQALMQRAGLIPSGVQESAAVSQFLQAVELVARRNEVRVSNWEELPAAPTADQLTDAANVDQVSGVGKNRWVVVGIKSVNSGIWSSRGGLNEWTERTNPAAGANLQAIIWDPINSLLIIVGDDDATDADILTSPDGITFLERAPTVAKAVDLNGLVSDGSALIVAVGDADGVDAYILRSTNGTAWVESANPKNFRLTSVAHSPTLSLFCAVGQADGTDAYIITSPDGITWLERVNGSNLQLNAIAWGNGRFVAVGVQAGTSPYIVESVDGLTWNTITVPELGNVDARSLKFSSELGLFLATADQDTSETDVPGAVFFSPDGLSWEVAYLPKTAFDPLGVGVGRSGALLVGTAGTIINSQRW